STVDPILNSSVDNFFWDFGIDSEIDDTSNEENPLFFYPADTGTYEVTLTVRTNYQCEATFKHDVIIGPDILVYIPNAFSPDGGGPGENDGFRAVVNDGAEYYHLIIFNRWGEVIWESEDRNEEWDGKYGRKDEGANRVDVPQDVYGYYLEIVSWSGEPFKYSGTITLIR
ncbi:MAG: gliding motility-associated C-terminal domain-containing protein, partial [Bacteroidia bacterium]|nr:gliding motility-associated C-terminal domain-containing protein [Bacteroidia bacterium]